MTPPPSVPAALRDLVFFSYRHEPDAERWLSALLAMLEPYSLTQSLVAWSDRDIRTGEHWNSLIQHTLGRSRVAVVLLNQHFFGSDTDAGDLLSSFDGHEAGVTGAVLLPGEGQVLSWSLDGTLRLWQLASAATCVVLRGHEAAVRGAVLIGSGNRALSWSEDHSLRLWRLSDGAELGRYHTEGAVSAVALDADETRVFVGDVAGHVQVLRLLAQV